VVIPPMTIDAHFHCWQLARGDYGWLTPALAPIYRDVTIADWQRESVPHGVTGGVLVQAAPTAAETRFLLQQAEEHPAVLGVVGWVDLLAADAPQRICALAEHPKLKGLRPMLQDIADSAWILQPGLTPALQAMTDCGLVFDALVKSVHLPHILTLAKRHPQLKVVIDHAAKPAIAHGEWQPWADAMARIAADTQAMCKLSGLLTEAGTASSPGAVPDAQPDAVLVFARPWADHVLGCFGPQRVVWGSDWPVLQLAASYAQWSSDTQEILERLSATDRLAVLGGNARRLYSL
jgi:L-fuconolactonase